MPPGLTSVTWTTQRTLLRDHLRTVKLWCGCANCGYKKCASALTFHHVDPATKLFSLTRCPQDWTFESVGAEIEKCVVLCANCHAEHHATPRSATALRKARQRVACPDCELVSNPGAIAVHRKAKHATI